LSPALVGIEYDPAADGTAAFAFEQGKANCLTYAHLFVAMARYVGLDARYLSLTLRPEWSRHGERVALRQHVNVLVRLRNGEQYMVDIDPVPRQRVASADILSDKEAYALYHGNLAMDALLFERKEEAYAHALKALELSDNLDYLWVNLGAIYSRNGQSEAAENAYQTALDINDDSPSAMNNLAVLYNAQGQYELAEQWAERVIKHRDRNPYYHYYLGAESEAQGDYERAIAYYLEAIELKDSDAEFHFRLAKLYFSLQKPAESIRYTEQAIERARLTGELKMYREYG
jgi:tetratricopeptide (TPR) repeat protein